MATLFNTKIKDTYQSLLKLEDNTILTTTTKNITDGLGNASPLFMSTTQVRIGSTSGSAMYWDNVNNRLGVGTTTPLGILHLKRTADTTRMVMDGDAGQSKIITYRTAGLQRFGLYVNNTAESGSNAGSDFAIRAYSDAGTLLNTPVFIKRSTGNVGIGTSSPTYRLDVSGTGRFSDTITYNGNLTPLSTSSAYSVGLSSTSVGGRITAYTNGGASGMQYFNFGFNNTSLITDGGFTNTSHNGIGFAITSTLGYGGTGGGTYTTFLINPTLNFAGNPNPGTYRAIYYNPTLTNLTNATHVAIETVTGNVILGSTSGNLLLGTTTDNGAKLRIESGDLSITGYQPKIILNGTATGQSYMRTNLAVEGYGLIGGIGLNTDIWLVQSAPGGVAYNIPATMHFKVNGANPLTSATSHWLAGDNGKSVGYEFLTTHYRNSVPAAWFGPEISGGIVGLQQFNIGYEPKQYAGAGFTFVGVGLSGVVTDPFTRVTEFNPIRIDYSLASGGSNITARGVYYRPTLTSVYPLLVNNAFESTSGSLVMSGEASRVSSTIGRGAYLNQTLRPANMTGDTLIGLDINPTFTSSATQISTFTYIGGTGYTYQTIWENIPLTGGTGTGATVNITVGAGNLVTAVSMANRGTGYTVNDVLTLPAQNMTQSTGFSVTVTAVGASTYNSYGLLVRSGNVGVGEASPTARLQVKGSGATSATSSLLVQNSAGTKALEVVDNGTISTFNNEVVINKYTVGGLIMSITTQNHFGARGINVTAGETGIIANSHYGVSTSSALGASIVANGGASSGGFSLGLLSRRALISTAANALGMSNSAMLQADSTTQGFLPPRMTTAEKNLIATPAAGLMVYDTDLARPCFFNGATWITL
jgi:hypothetical protein